VVAVVTEFPVYEFGGINETFPKLSRILEKTHASNRAVPRKRSRTPA
jgi:hypothetical protein